MATELLLRAKTKFKVDLAVRDLFQYPTVASLAKLIDSIKSESTGDKTANDESSEHRLDLVAEVRRHDQGVTKLVTGLSLSHQRYLLIAFYIVIIPQTYKISILQCNRHLCIGLHKDHWKQ